MSKALLGIHMPKPNSAVATGGGGGARGAVPPLRLLVPPHFDVLKLLFMEHHVTARQHQ